MATLIPLFGFPIFRDMEPEVVVAVLTLAGVTVSTFVAVGLALLQYQHKRTLDTHRMILDEVNDAVNQRHEKQGVGAPKLYDMLHENTMDTKELLDWKRGYEGGPMDEGSKVIGFVERVVDIEERIANCRCADKKA